MRIHRGNLKGQSTIEYALILVLIILVVLLIIALIIPGIRHIMNAVGNSLGLQPPTPPLTAPATAPNSRAFIIMMTVLTTMGLPALVSFITSIWDGSVGQPGRLAAANLQVPRDNQGRCKKCGMTEKHGSFSAKLCLSAISFEVWGITNSFQTDVNIRPNLGAEKSQLAVLLLILVLVDLAFHFLCSKWIPDNLIELRIFLVLLAVFSPVFVFYGLTG